MIKTSGLAALSIAVCAGCVPEAPQGEAAAPETPAIDESIGLTMPPPRDGNIAVREEYDVAIALDTVEALELFIARHPEHPLADLARARLAEISR